jgi:hypothetical protein
LLAQGTDCNSDRGPDSLAACIHRRRHGRFATRGGHVGRDERCPHAPVGSPFPLSDDIGRTCFAPPNQEVVFCFSCHCRPCVHDPVLLLLLLLFLFTPPLSSSVPLLPFLGPRPQGLARPGSKLSGHPSPRYNSLCPRESREARLETSLCPSHPHIRKAETVLVGLIMEEIGAVVEGGDLVQVQASALDLAGGSGTPGWV